MCSRVRCVFVCLLSLTERGCGSFYCAISPKQHADNAREVEAASARTRSHHMSILRKTAKEGAGTMPPKYLIPMNGKKEQTS